MYIIVCYDISSNRRRARLHEMLLGYGSPVQKSVFECDLNLKQFKKMRKEARPYVKKGESIRYYQLCGRCRQRTHAEGTSLVETHDQDFAV